MSNGAVNIYLYKCKHLVRLINGSRAVDPNEAWEVLESTEIDFIKGRSSLNIKEREQCSLYGMGH